MPEYLRFTPEQDAEGIPDTFQDEESRISKDDTIDGDSDFELPRKRQKRMTVMGRVDDVDAEYSMDRWLKRELRWFYLFEFSNRNLRKFLVGAKPELKTQVAKLDKYEETLGHVTRNFKSETLKRMKHYIKVAIARSKESGGTDLEAIDRKKNLHKHFWDNMTEADFFKVFYWLKPIVDFEKTGPLGQWYLKQIFCNVAAKCKRYLDKEQKKRGDIGDGDDSEEEGATVAGDLWNNIIEWWPTLGTNPELKGITRKDFAERREIVRRNKNDKTKEQLAKELAKHHTDFVKVPRPVGSTVVDGDRDEMSGRLTNSETCIYP